MVANGSLLDETPLPPVPVPGGLSARAGQRTLTRWRESHPIPVYLMTIAAAPLVRYDLGSSACGFARDGGCVTQMVYVAPEQRRSMPGDFRYAGDIVDFFSHLVAPVSVRETRARAEQHAFRRHGERERDLLRRRRLPEGRHARGATIAHETAHQWFGDAVTEREWSHLWLSEGFATYFEALWTRHAFGDSAFEREMAGTRARAAARPGGRVASRDRQRRRRTCMRLLDANSYQKGGWTLHMLRSLVGDSAFFRGDSRLLRRARGRQRHPATIS